MSTTSEFLLGSLVDAESKTSFELSQKPYTKYTQSNSPLFHLIFILKSESSPLVASIQSCKGNLAFLINITPSTMHIPLFPTSNYKLISRHFRIDQYCKIDEKNRQGLSPIHYTATYKFESDPSKEKQFIVVHGFLNSHGDYLYSEIKSYQDEARTLLSLTQFTTKEVQDLEQSLIVNINISRTLLNNLIQEKKKRTTDLKAQADKDEQELLHLSHNTLNFQKSLEKYIVASRLLIKGITKLNQYSDIPDPRLKIIQDRLSVLTERAALLKVVNLSTVATAQEEDNHPEVNNDIESVQNSIESTLESVVEATIDTLEKDEKQLSALPPNDDIKPYGELFLPNLTKIVAQQEVITKTEEHLMLALCLPNTLSVKNKKRLEQLLTRIHAIVEKHYDQCLKILDFGKRSRNLLTIQTLFPLLEAKVSKEFFEELIDELINSKNKEIIQEFIVICDYFHVHSSLYNNTVLEMSEKKTYKIARKKIPNFPLLQDDSEQIIESFLLFTIYINNNLDAFRMLLKHGANPNAGALQSEIHKATVNTTLYSIVLYYAEYYLDYIQVLLQYNANPNVVYSDQYVLNTHRQVLKTTVTARKIITGGFARCPVAIVPVPIILIALREHSTGIDLLLHHTDVSDLALLLATIATSPEFAIRRRNTPEPLLCLLPDLSTVNDKFPQEERKFFPFLTFIIYPTENSEKINTIENYSTYFQSAHEILKMHMLTLTSDSFEKAYQKLFITAEKESLKNEYNNAYMHFIACEFLFIERYKSLSIESEKFQLLEKYIPTLSTTSAPIISQRFFGYPADTIERYKGYLTVRVKACKKLTPMPQPAAITFSFSNKPAVTDNVTRVTAEDNINIQETKKNPLKTKLKHKKNRV